MRTVFAAVAVACLSLAPTLSHATTPAGFEDPGYAPGETRIARNTLYLELLGSAGLYSLNYERFTSDNVAVRVGGSYLGVSASSGSASASASMIVVPLTVSYLGIGTGGHAFELGAGIDVVVLSGSATSGSGSSAFGSGTGVAGTGILGYRYAPLDGGFNFRAALTPLFGAGGFLPYFGIAFGAGF